MVDEEMEKLYMPSNWVTRVTPEQSVPLHVQLTREESMRVRREEPGQLGVRFGAESGDWLDLFNESGTSGVLMVYLSGGYWQELSGELSSYPVSPLAREGHTVAVVNYTRAPAQDMDAMIRQVERAGSWLLSWAQQNDKQVWFMGHSAGSHLCAMLLSGAWYDGLPVRARKRVLGVVHLSGVFQLHPLLKTSVNILGLGLSAGTVQHYSPGHTENLAKLTRAGQHLVSLVVVGEADSPAFHRQAEEYGDSLEAAGMRVVRSTVPREDHFSLVEKLADSNYSLTKDILRLVAGLYSLHT